MPHTVYTRAHLDGCLYCHTFFWIGIIFPYNKEMSDECGLLLDTKTCAGVRSEIVVYWIVCGAKNSYIGATVCLPRRLRQHNGEIKGGARRTCGRGPWRLHRVIRGFRVWREALQFEWAFKYYSRGARSLVARENSLIALMHRDRWTSNSPLAADVPLTIHDHITSDNQV